VTSGISYYGAFKYVYAVIVSIYVFTHHGGKGYHNPLLSASKHVTKYFLISVAGKAQNKIALQAKHQATNQYRVHESNAPRILSLGTRWRSVVGFTLRQLGRAPPPPPPPAAARAGGGWGGAAEGSR
jgi:hypothetical protein